MGATGAPAPCQARPAQGRIDVGTDREGTLFDDHWGVGCSSRRAADAAAQLRPKIDGPAAPSRAARAELEVTAPRQLKKAALHSCSAVRQRDIAQQRLVSSMREALTVDVSLTRSRQALNVDDIKSFA